MALFMDTSLVEALGVQDLDLSVTSNRAQRQGAIAVAFQYLVVSV